MLSGLLIAPCAMERGAAPANMMAPHKRYLRSRIFGRTDWGQDKKSKVWWPLRLSLSISVVR